MELTRRDALAALTSAEIGGGTATTPRRGSMTFEAETDDLPSSEEVMETLVGDVDLVSPSAVSTLPTFVETDAGTRMRQRPGYRDTLFASPTGGKLVDIEKSQGHSGGSASYRQEPN